ncbi:2-polyprenyl-3-methyl-5-hydroxy-6-metoxy-1,4-benzoquinol methylase [Sinorhizobium fredii]|uniref:class I SAM-dependent methyltransferase n=1 Tax=Rhizobium fredii TaxID=380 RepID=UPI0035122E2E
MALIRTLAGYFQTSEKFVGEVLKRRIRSNIESAHNLASLKSSVTAHEYKSAHYMLNSTLRGKKFVEWAKKHSIIPQSARRALDIGAGYGGLTAALNDEGLASVGVELERSYVDMARMNLEGKSADLRVGDILQMNPTELGTFDFITCIAVIEHVNDVESLLRRISDLLNPGGAVVLQSPNHRAIQNVIGDIHHRIFGVQLLSYSAARRSQ